MILKICETLNGFASILGDIAVNETGFVRQRSGFAAAWVVGVLVVGAVLLGAPEMAVADECSPYSQTMIPCIPETCDHACSVWGPSHCHGYCKNNNTWCECYSPWK